MESLAINEDAEERGAVFTRREVVDFILDLVGYTADRPLHHYHLLVESHAATGMEPWLLESSAQTTLVRRLEQTFPTLEEAGCKVGIGVATGADKAFVGDFDTLAVEPDRKVPLVTTRDIQSGEVRWRGSGVINPFSEAGSLVDLREYPRLRRYLESRLG